MVYYTRLIGEGSHAVIHFYEIRKPGGVVHILSNSLRALSHLDDAKWRCLKLFL